jgi:streptogramin lyase
MSTPAREALAAAVTVTALVVMPSVAGASLSFVAQWGGLGAGQGQFSVPQGVAVDAGGDVYVADLNNDRVEKFDSNGRFLLQFGSHGSGPGQFNNPGHVALDPQGNVIVSDEGGYRVEKFSPTGTFLVQYGQFSGNTRGVAADAAGNVYVVQSGQIVKLTSAGSYITSWAARAPGARNPIPGSLAFDPSGVLYVTDQGDGSIDKFATDGRFLGQWGQFGNAPQQLADPRAIAIDPQSHVFVGDRLQGIKQFTTTGAFLGLTNSTGQPPPNDSFSVAGVGVGPGGDVFVTDPGSAKRVIRFRQGPAPVLGSKVNVAVVSGRVLVRLPGRGFVRLSAARQIPVGSTLDTRRGVVGLTSAANTSGAVQSATFSSGLFQVQQSRRLRGLTDLNLAGGSLACTARAGSRASASAPAGATAPRPSAAPSGTRSTAATARSPASPAASWSCATSACGATSSSGPATATSPAPARTARRFRVLNAGAPTQTVEMDDGLSDLRAREPPT